MDLPITRCTARSGWPRRTSRCAARWSRRVRREHGHARDARRGHLLPRGQRAGALLSLGDGHARQGEGETCGVAVECAMNTVLIVDLIKGTPCPWPRLESDTHHVGRVGPAAGGRVPHRPDDMVTWVAGLCGLDRWTPTSWSPRRWSPAGQRVRHQRHLDRQDDKALPGAAPDASAMGGAPRPAARARRRVPALSFRAGCSGSVSRAPRPPLAGARSVPVSLQWPPYPPGPAGGAASIAARSSALSVRSSAFSARPAVRVGVDQRRSSPREATQAMASCAAVTRGPRRWSRAPPAVRGCGRGLV